MIFSSIKKKNLDLSKFYDKTNTINLHHLYSTTRDKIALCPFKAK